jgi:hypothetical protein
LEINIGDMPFLYSNQSVSHVPDVDIHPGVGDRFQRTYEGAWLRVQNPPQANSTASRNLVWVNPIPV